MAHNYLAIPASSCIAEQSFSFLDALTMHDVENWEKPNLEDCKKFGLDI
jgi:hypothetical protein